MNFEWIKETDFILRERDIKLTLAQCSINWNVKYYLRRYFLPSILTTYIYVSVFARQYPIELLARNTFISSRNTFRINKRREFYIAREECEINFQTVLIETEKRVLWLEDICRNITNIMKDTKTYKI